MPTQRARRREMIERASTLLAKGMSDRQVQKALRDPPHSVSEASARRYVAAAHAEQARRLQKARPRLIAAQSAKLDTAQRTAMAAVKHFTDKGQVVETVPQPDVGAFVSAVGMQNRLLGLNAPERHEIIVATVNTAMADVVALVMRHLTEDRRGAFMADLDDLIEKRALHAKMGGDTGRDAPSAVVVSSPSETPQPPSPPAAGGADHSGNGGAAG